MVAQTRSTPVLNANANTRTRTPVFVPKRTVSIRRSPRIRNQTPVNYTEDVVDGVNDDDDDDEEYVFEHDFDESSRAWRANKTSTGNGCYIYTK